MLDLARVVATHPGSNTVDVVSLRSGRRMAGVQVMAGSAGAAHGVHDLPMPAEQEHGDPFEAREDSSRATLAVLGVFQGLPLVLGFLFPAVSQLLFNERDRLVHRHASDLYWTADQHGNCELAHPSGTYLRIGTAPAHEDLTGRDADGRWVVKRNKGKAVHVQVTVAGAGGVKASLNIDPAGHVTLTHSGNLAINTSGTAAVTSSGAATLKAPSVKIDSPQTTCTGKLTVQGGLAVSGGSGGAAATVAGGMQITGGDVTVDGIGVKSHHHTEQGDGAPTTAAQA